MSLFAGLPYQDRLGNDIYTDFRNMLRLEPVLDDPELSESEKAVACLLLLYGEDIPEDFEAAYGELIWFYHRGQTPEKPKGRITKLFDFEEDSAYIIGSFLAEYRIDLTNADYYLHWWQFMTLFVALPDNTTMVKRMCDRNIDTSKMKGEQRRYYEERKKAVALKSARPRPGASPRERGLAQQKRLDELYAQAERELAERGGADASH